VLSGLSAQETAVTPAWAKDIVAADTLVAAGLKLPSLLEALTAYGPIQEDERLGALDWVAPDDSTITVELLLPLMLLAHDLRQLEEEAEEVVLDGA